MSIKSTYDISRVTAINIIQQKIVGISNQDLSEILETFKESDFRNYNVQDEIYYEELTESEKDRCIENIDEF